MAGAHPAEDAGQQGEHQDRHEHPEEGADGPRGAVRRLGTRARGRALVAVARQRRRDRRRHRGRGGARRHPRIQFRATRWNSGGWVV